MWLEIIWRNMKKIKTPKTNTDNNFYNLKGKNAEKMVQRLAIKTFLADWCYLNLDYLTIRNYAIY